MARWPADNQEALIAFYGDPGGGQVDAQLVRIAPPFRMTYEGTWVEHLIFHKKAAAALLAALNAVWNYYGRDQAKVDALGISKTAGTFNKRKIAGSNRWSNHAFAAAIDINAEENGFNVAGNIPRPMIAAFKAQGARWGGDYRGRTDPMHFEFCASGEPEQSFEAWLAHYGIGPAPAATGGETLSGKMSVFGGPEDTGVKPDEGLALVEPSEVGKFPGIFLGTQPSGTTGLARRLDPASHYLAMRWDYSRTPRAWLQQISVKASANGKTIDARPVDWGPNVRTGRIADLSPGLAAALGLQTDDVVHITIPATPGAHMTVTATPVPAAPGAANLVQITHLLETAVNFIPTISMFFPPLKPLIPFLPMIQGFLAMAEELETAPHDAQAVADIVIKHLQSTAAAVQASKAQAQVAAGVAAPGGSNTTGG